MIRRHLAKEGGERDFRWRGGEVSRLEGMTDAVFAFGLTLLVVSLEVPSTFAELRAAFVQLPVFLACFAILYWCWHCHFQFHRRYGLEDAFTIFLNAAMLFIVLFYVYPLKFLFRTLYTMILHGAPYRLDATGEPRVDATTGERLYAFAERGEMVSLMLLYSGGFVALFLVYALMTWHAWRKRDALELDERERVITLGTIRVHLLSAGIGVVSLGFALAGQATIAGMTYFLMGPAHGVHGYFTGRRVERLRPEES